MTDKGHRSLDSRYCDVQLYQQMNAPSSFFQLVPWHLVLGCSTVSAHECSHFHFSIVPLTSGIAVFNYQHMNTPSSSFQLFPWHPVLPCSTVLAHEYSHYHLSIVPITSGIGVFNCINTWMLLLLPFNWSVDIWYCGVQLYHHMNDPTFTIQMIPWHPVLRCSTLSAYECSHFHLSILPFTSGIGVLNCISKWMLPLSPFNCSNDIWYCGVQLF